MYYCLSKIYDICFGVNLKDWRCYSCTINFFFRSMKFWINTVKKTFRLYSIKCLNIILNKIYFFVKINPFCN